MREDRHTSTVEGAAAFERDRALDDEVAHDRYLEAGEELAEEAAIEDAIRRGEARECCGQVVGVDESCPECGS